jgi:hypothetical protein
MAFLVWIKLNEEKGKCIITQLILIAFPNHMMYIIAPSSLAGRGLGVGFSTYSTENRYIKL